MDNPEKLVGENRRAMDNPEKLVAWGTQDEEKHNTICVGHHCLQTIANNVNKT